MAIFHCSIKIVSRAKGKSVVGAAAYRSGEKFKNEYDGEIHDYTRKGGIAFTGILLPSNAPTEYADRCTLWNAVERVERAKNAQLARDIEVAIPKEIPKDNWVKMMEEYCNTNFVSKGMIADYCIHDKQDGNPHCHILLTMRPLNENGEFGAKCKKEYVLDDKGEKIKLPSGAFKSFKVDSTDWNSKDNAEVWRSDWANICNRFLDENNITERIDHRSYERQGIDKIPSIHLGVACSQMEQKGIATERGNINRQIAEDNKLLKVTRARISRLMKWIKDEKNNTGSILKADEKESVLQKLAMQKTQSPTTQSGKIKDLKTQAKVVNFLLANNIDSIEVLFEKLSSMNKEFYDIQGNIKNANNQLSLLNNHIVVYADYTKNKGILKKYRSLTGKKQEQFYDNNVFAITDMLKAEETLRGWKVNGLKFTPKLWQENKATIENYIAKENLKLSDLRGEIASAENIRKRVELMTSVQSMKNKNKQAEI